MICLPLVFAAAIFAQNESVYTDLSEKQCKTLELSENEGALYKGECRGVGGYKLHLLEGDLRQTVNVIAAGGNEHELRLWEIFGGFSYLGPRAEWRIKGKTPVSLIVRFNVSQDPEDSTKTTSYLIVSKITKTKACVTDVIRPSRTQNANARKLADRSAAKQCKL